MNELVLIRPATIGDEAVQAVDSFDLYRSLKVEAKHADWIKRRLRLANLREHFDFEVVLNSENNSAGRPEVHYLLSLDAAKHIAMMEKTPVAWEVRCYFIEREKDSRLGTSRPPVAPRSRWWRPRSASCGRTWSDATCSAWNAGPSERSAR